MKKIFLIVGIVLGLLGLFRIDYTLYLGLNYFGKYVFFAFFNGFIIYLFWILYKKSKEFGIFGIGTFLFLMAIFLELF